TVRSNSVRFTTSARENACRSSSNARRILHARETPSSVCDPGIFLFLRLAIESGLLDRREQEKNNKYCAQRKYVHTLNSGYSAYLGLHRKAMNACCSEACTADRPSSTADAASGSR